MEITNVVVVGRGDFKINNFEGRHNFNFFGNTASLWKNYFWLSVSQHIGEIFVYRNISKEVRKKIKQEFGLKLKLKLKISQVVGHRTLNFTARTIISQFLAWIEQNLNGITDFELAQEQNMFEKHLLSELNETTMYISFKFKTNNGTIAIKIQKAREETEKFKASFMFSNFNLKSRNFIDYLLLL